LRFLSKLPPNSQVPKSTGNTMSILSSQELVAKKCLPCEGGVDACTIDHARQQMTALGDWTLTEDGKSISRKLTLKNFVKAMELLQKVAVIAEEDQHHPDLHLTGYRQVKIVLTTHAIGGLSENDFILAAKIDAVIGS
jgi:4a-hydroxytetrahydrobiopterin dehydratase